MIFKNEIQKEHLVDCFDWLIDDVQLFYASYLRFPYKNNDHAKFSQFGNYANNFSTCQIDPILYLTI